MDSQSENNSNTGTGVGHHHHHHRHHQSFSPSPPIESLPPPPLPPFYGTCQGSGDNNSTGIVVSHHHHHQSYKPPPPPPPAMDSQSEETNSAGIVVGHRHHKPYLPPPPPHYGTFQGIPNSASDPRYYAYQSVPSYGCVADEEGKPIRERRPLCCGIGLGWIMFLLGFFFAGIPWYAGAVLLICSRERSLDSREKPGYILCLIAALLVTIAIVLGMSEGDDFDW